MFFGIFVDSFHSFRKYLVAVGQKSQSFRRDDFSAIQMRVRESSAMRNRQEAELAVQI